MVEEVQECLPDKETKVILEAVQGEVEVLKFLLQILVLCIMFNIITAWM